VIDTDKINFTKSGGLVPAVVIDSITDQILMLGFMNRESLELTMKTKRVTFFSRTRNKLWTKGETSGNFLDLIDIKKDCDSDSLLVYALPTGNTCHTGEYSCFGLEKKESRFLEYLFEFIRRRKFELPEASYTTSLFTGNSDRIIQKVGEEAIETIIAAKNRDRSELLNEVSDLIYHLFVMLTEQDITLDEIGQTLRSRHQNKK
jgi:phosphoribosyl-AMP cyclohydrolase / phosphoribosyl-ATP pyrophosphohydrolase